MDLTLLSDIFPTGYHGAVHGGRRARFNGLHRRGRAGRSGSARPAPICLARPSSSSAT